jgi:hypothetical protein
MEVTLFIVFLIVGFRIKKSIQDRRKMKFLQEEKMTKSERPIIIKQQIEVDPKIIIGAAVFVALWIYLDMEEEKSKSISRKITEIGE